ncbi:MAG TPA: alpha-ketoacid dehydrogenase subunit beta [Thermomicrobiaceae bacterium]|nr:alpha-ketoacid dehydrogenase subunit beta [Thermomicrobiaceae bacterium]
MANKLLIDAIRDTLISEMRADERHIIMGEDVGQRGGVFRVTAGMVDEFGPDRVINTPLAESSIIGVAIGASMHGLLPIAEIQFLDFIHPAMNQIMSEAAKIRYRSAGDFNCPIVIRTPYGGGVHGALYHSQSIEAIFAREPGLKVVAPIMPDDAAGMLRSALEDPDPVLYLEHKKGYRAIRGEVPENGYRVPLGKAKVVKEGSDATIISYGMMLIESLAAAEALEQRDGSSIEVIDLRTLYPLDNETILESACKTGKVLIVHEANKTGGLGGEVAAIIAEEAFPYLDAPIMRVCGPDAPAIAFSRPLEDAFLPTRETIGATLDKLAAY